MHRPTFLQAAGPALLVILAACVRPAPEHHAPTGHDVLLTAEVAEPTEPPTNTDAPPTNTERPSATSKPTATPTLSATQTKEPLASSTMVPDVADVPKLVVWKRLSLTGPEPLAFHEDHQHLVFGAGGTTLLNIDSEQEIWHFYPPDGDYGTYAVAVSPDGKLIATGGSAGYVYLLDADTGEVVSKAAHKLGRYPLVNAITFALNGTKILSGDCGESENGGLSLRVWNWQTENEPVTIAQHCVRGLAASPDTRQVAVFGQGLSIYDAETLAETVLVEPGQWVFSVAFSLDAKVIAAIVDDQLLLWDTISGESAVAPGWQALQTDVWAVSFSPAGDLATAGANSLVIWDLATLQAKYSAQYFQGTVTRIDFSSDGRLIATSGSEMAVTIWSLYRP